MTSRNVSWVIASVTTLFLATLATPAMAHGDAALVPGVRVEANWATEPAVAGAPNALVVALTELPPEPAPTSKHMRYNVSPNDPAPGVTLAALRDPKGGWNLHVVTTNFTFAPQNASTPHVPGEGHAHLFVDGTKINRLYGDWYYLAELPKGNHSVRVTLNTNMHADLYVNDEPVAAQTIVVGEGAAPKPTPLRVELRHGDARTTFELAPHAVDQGRYEVPFAPLDAGDHSVHVMGPWGAAMVDAFVEMDAVAAPRPADPSPEPELETTAQPTDAEPTPSSTAADAREAPAENQTPVPVALVILAAAVGALAIARRRGRSP